MSSHPAESHRFHFLCASTTRDATHKTKMTPNRFGSSVQTKTPGGNFRSQGPKKVTCFTSALAITRHTNSTSPTTTPVPPMTRSRLRFSTPKPQATGNGRTTSARSGIRSTFSAQKLRDLGKNAGLRTARVPHRPRSCGGNRIDISTSMIDSFMVVCRNQSFVSGSKCNVPQFPHLQETKAFSRAPAISPPGSIPNNCSSSSSRLPTEARSGTPFRE